MVIVLGLAAVTDALRPVNAIVSAPETWRLTTVKAVPDGCEWDDSEEWSEPTRAEMKAIELRDARIVRRAKDGSAIVVVPDHDTFRHQWYVLSGKKLAGSSGVITCIENGKSFAGFTCDYGMKATEASPRSAFISHNGKVTTLGFGTPILVRGDLSVVECGLSRDGRAATSGYEEKWEIRFVTPRRTQRYPGKSVLGEDRKGGIWFHSKTDHVFETEVDVVACWRNGKIERAVQLPVNWMAEAVTGDGQVLCSTETNRNLYEGDLRQKSALKVAWLRGRSLAPVRFGTNSILNINHAPQFKWKSGALYANAGGKSVLRLTR